jgi:hypothetical protein
MFPSFSHLSTVGPKWRWLSAANKERNKFVRPLTPHLGVQILVLFDVFVYIFPFSLRIRSFSTLAQIPLAVMSTILFSESNYALINGGI